MVAVVCTWSPIRRKDRVMDKCMYCGTVTDSGLLCDECVVNHWNKLCESPKCEACQIVERIGA